MLYVGVVENRHDPLKLGRCQVRVVGLHNHDKTELPTGDLPWATPMQPVTSAALSGIGSTPLGPVEGSWVIIMFTDEANQIPIMIGTVGGIPQRDFADITSSSDTITLKLDGLETKSNSQSSVLVDSSGETVTDGNGNPIQAGSTEAAATVEDSKLKRALDFTISSDAINIIKQYEGLRLTSYQDSVGVWTIGYGTTNINGQPVVQGLTITKEDAEAYLKQHVNEVVAPTLKRQVRSLVTQSMIDALASFTYNLGSGNLAKSTLLKDLNSGKYLDAAAGFLQWTKAGNVEQAGLVKRRKSEKDLFLKDGIPNEAGEVTQQQQPQQDVQQAQNNNAAAADTTNATASRQVVVGFSDPSGKYPLYFSEPDTNRLARHEEIQKTIVYKKEASLDKGVEIAGGGTWDQSPIPYNAQYPFNHVMQTESGHVLEFDDTPNSERIHTYHKSGTFTEIDANGTQVNRIVGDGYTILERNGFVHIQGTLNVTVEGAQNVLVKNGMNLDVYGATNINVFNDVNLKVSGSMNASVGKEFNLKADSIRMESNTFDVFNTNDLHIQAGGQTHILSGGNINLEAPQIHAANGADGADTTGLDAPEGVKEISVPDFNTLTVITREAQAAGQYETPDEGDPTAYQNRQIQTGAIKQETLNSGEQTDSADAAANNVQPTGASCDAIFKMTTFDPSYPLSKNFTLSALTARGSRMPVSQVGLTPQQIVCNLKGLCENVIEVIHDYYPNMTITSGFRRPGDVANSSKTSNHYNGEAVDIVIPSLDRKGHYEAIKKLQTLLPYDQLILEYSGARTVWIHCSFKYTGNRKQIFTMRDHHRIGNMGQFILVE